MFLEREDRALKLKLKDELSVSDMANQARPVDVWFRYPDKEVRDVVYPFITIDFVGLRKADEREHRGVIPIEYKPEDYTYVDPTASTAVETDVPVPYEIYYALSAYSRNPLHDRQLVAQLIQYSSRLSMRFGYLEVPEDKTLRRLDVLGMEVTDYKDEAGTVFRKVFTATVSAELFLSEILESRVTETLNLTLGEADLSTILAETPDVGS